VQVARKAAATGRENGNALGKFVPIQNEASLRPFHAALAALEAGTLPGGKLRILAYGASHTQGDVYTGYLRYYLQSRFGDGGLGFVQMAQLDKGYRLLDLQIESNGFFVHHAQRSAQSAHGHFGLLGAVAVASSRGAYARIRQSRARRDAMGAATLAVYLLGDARAADVELFVDGQRRGRRPLRRASPELVVLEARAPTGFSQVSVKPAGSGEVRLFGAVVERPEPGIVVDTLGISGTRAANWLKWDEKLWTQQVARRNPQLVMLAYGTNESTDEYQPIEVYERDLDAVLTRLKRAAPQASCLLIGPADVAKKQRGAWISRPRLAGVIAVQLRQARSHGCGFWDARRFMGDGGIARWHRAAPRMAAADHIHLTRRGYVKLGLGLGDALLRNYDGAHHSSPISVRD
jgi:lysophospholipase L1-like esterase